MVKVALTLMALFITSPAWACGIMESASPKVGSTVQAADRVELHFSESIVPEQSGAAITDESGRNIPATKPVISDGDKQLSVALRKPLLAGKYKVTWNVLWLDCDSKTQGDFKFNVK